MPGSKFSQLGKALPSAVLASRPTVARESACWNVSFGKVKLNAEPVGTVVAPKVRTLTKPPEPEALPPAALLDELSALEAVTRTSPAVFRVTWTGAAALAAGGVAELAVAVGVAVDAPAGVAAGVETVLVVAGVSVAGTVAVLVLAAGLLLVLLAVLLALVLVLLLVVPLPEPLAVGVEFEVELGAAVKVGALAMSTWFETAIVTATGVDGVGTAAGGVTTGATDGGKGATVDGTGLMSALVDASVAE